MNKLMNALSSHTTHVLVNTEIAEGGFTLAVGLLGKAFTTSPALTQRILASPEFDQLLSSDRATRILEMVLEQAQQ